MTTVGDRVLNTSLPKIGEKALFTKDLEDALRNGGVDFVVHSLKDLPTALPVGMAIGAILKREDPRDALVLNEKYRGKKLSNLPEGSIIGTSSLRRSAQLARYYKHLVVCDIRGNLNTRLAKLDAPNSKFAGIILAQAGLVRMGWDKRIDQVLEPDEILYAVGQGALAVECRSNDKEILEMLSKLSCLDTQCKILAERSFLKTLGGGCSAPVAVCTNLKRKHDNNFDIDLKIDGAVWSLNGSTEIKSDINCSVDLSNDEDNEVTPMKKRKLDDNVEDNGNKARKSPEVIDDSKVLFDDKSDGDSTNPKSLDIEALINIHGEVFKKCPYSLQHQENRLKQQKDKDGNSTDSIDGCPLKIPIGQDFMGQCPYFNIEQKVDIGDKCPITGKTKSDTENNNPSGKCPFTSQIDTPLPSTSDKCPFLISNAAAGVKLFEYDENTKYIQPTIVDDTETLFCGMFRHESVQSKLFETCQQLGIKLAEKLIKKGAMDVMNIAQQEIRGEQKS